MNNYISNINIWQDSGVESISTCTKTDTKLLNKFIYWHQKYPNIFLGQEQLAKSLGVDRSTIHRSCKRLASLGLITMQSGTRDKNRKFKWGSNIYKVSEGIFKNAAILKNILPALKAYCNQVFIDSWYKNATPYKEVLFNTLSNSMIIKGLSQVPLTLVSSWENFNKKIKKAESMETSPFKVSDVLKRITEALSLNNHGQIRLLVYPEQALEYGYVQLCKQSYVKAPYFWLLKFLDDYCRKNNLHVDWDLLPILKKKYDITGDNFFAPKIVTKTIARPIIPVVEKVIVSPLVGKYKEPHPMFARFIPDDLKLPKANDESICFEGGSGTITETEIYSLQSV